MQQYIIRKNIFGRISGYKYETKNSLIIEFILFIIFSPLVVFFVKEYFVKTDDTGFLTNFYYACIAILVFYVLSFCYRYYMFLKIKGLNDLKTNGSCYVKKVKVVSIGEYKVSKNDDSSYAFKGHFFVLSDGYSTYYSNAFSGGSVGGMKKEKFAKIYEKFGYSYDDNESNKEAVLRAYDKMVEDIKYKSEHSGFFESISNIMMLKFGVGGDRSVIERGYIPPYLWIGGSKVSEGDMLDVYISNDDPDKYWVDIAFLFGGSKAAYDESNDNLIRYRRDYIKNHGHVDPKDYGF